MDISNAALTQVALQKELHDAFARWMALCEITARKDGVSQEDLQQELDWLQKRRDLLLQRSTHQHMRQVVADIQNAEVWVHSGLRAHMQDLRALSHAAVDKDGAAMPTINHFKHALQAGLAQIGLWSALPFPYASKVIAGAGFDWLLLDSAHAPSEVQQLLQAMAAATPGEGPPCCHAVVRPAGNDPQAIQQYLGMGAQTLLLSVQSAAQALAAVETVRAALADMACMGHGAGHALDSICLLVQVETREALSQLEAIARVDGVDGVFIGPADLSIGLGYSDDGSQPDGMRALIAQALAAVRACGKAPGILAPDPESVQDCLDAGALFVVVGTDMQLLREGADALAARFKTAQAGPGLGASMY
ncbi:aldolase/citrate lyase family protein [Comamonas sp. GB3 AK4-5]|uniref:aldolase/citrate lyase family protein n=1 Tax=Comamonas sp. GB3 AK4-5 TaxID=3231487 RepID=UPI00351F2742